MITAFQIQSSAKSVAIRFLLRAMAAGAAFIPAISGAQDDKPVVMDKLVVNAAKTHTLFMGADFSVELDKDLYPVRGVIGSSWVIDINGEEKVVSAKKAPMDLKITPMLKLTDVSARIVGYKKVRAYSFKNDPSVMLTRGLNEAAMTNAYLMDNASDAQAVADTMSNKALGAAGLFATSDNQLGAAGMLATAAALSGRTSATAAPTGNYTQATAIAEAGAYAVTVAASAAASLATAQGTAAADLSQTQNGDEPAGRIATTGLDAMDVEFDVSSERPLQKPYVVTLARFHPKGTKPGTVQNLVYAKELHPIDAHPTNVHLVEDGFPPDFELVDFQLHLYNRGEEVATTVSSERVELTRDEAFEYVRIEYISTHKGATLPASPAMGILPADLPGRLAHGEFKETIFVRVSKDGFAGEPFADASCSKRIEDPYLETVVRCIRFDPALAQGKPVEGVASVDLRQLKI
jgi:hypothetical protein